MAISVAADSAYIDIPGNAKLSISSITVAGWFQFSEHPSTSTRALWGWGAATGFYAYAISDPASTPLGCTSVGGSDRVPNTRNRVSDWVAPIGTWFYLVSQLDFTDTAQANWKMRSVYGHRPWGPNLSFVAGSSAVWATPATPGFRVLSDHASHNGRGAAAYVRVFRGLIPIQQVLKGQHEERCPAELRSACLIDMPLGGEARNYGTLGGVGSTVGTVSFIPQPRLRRPPRFRRPYVHVAVPSGGSASPPTRKRLTALNRGYSSGDSL